MKKYFLKKNNQEIKVGDKIQLSRTVNTSYGEGVVTTDLEVSEEILERLIHDDFVEVREEKSEGESVVEGLKPFIRRIARKNNLDFPATCAMLQVILEVNPKAHFQLMVDVIAEVKNRGKEAGKETYYLNPLSSFKPVLIIGNPNSATVFYSAEDALEAHRLLLPFIRDIVNGE